MGTVRIPLPNSCTKPGHRNIKGVMYGRQASDRRPINVPTGFDPKLDSLAVPRFPYLENIFGVNANLQEAWVTCTDTSGKVHRFFIAAQYDAAFPVNKALLKVLPPITWRGPLLVMRGGGTLSHVDISTPIHRELANEAVRKFLTETEEMVIESIALGEPLDLPTEFY
ncbi:hypothetical protein C8T65DRAFT_700112 [Cerioporus squamosus]|nr:hypothetical protein C8T65DRAFT_700112 [Cerioporus squamosus]